MAFWKKNKVKEEQEVALLNDDNKQNNSESVKEKVEITPEYLDKMWNFIRKKGFFLKVKDPFDAYSEETFWQIGPMGKLIRENLLRWWIDSFQSFKNVVGIKKISNERHLYKQYKSFQELNSQTIPFGISRVQKLPREQFRTKAFKMTNEDSRIFLLEFFVDPDSSKVWLSTWKDYLAENMQKLGIAYENMEINFEHKDDLISSSGGFFSERFKFKFNFPFGQEDILTLTNKIDFDFNSITDIDLSENLKYKPKNSDEKVFPHLIEIRVDVEKLVLALLLNKYNYKVYKNIENTSIVFTPLIAPIKCGIFPESNSDPVLNATRQLNRLLSEKFKVVMETDGNVTDRIKHYREFGVPYFIILNDKNINANGFSFFDSLKEQWSEKGASEIISYVKENSK